MRAYIVRRLAQFLPVLLLAMAGIWAMIYALPGSPASVLAGDNATSVEIAAIEARYGLDQPVWTQFFTWLGNAVQGDLGISFSTSTPVGELLLDRLPATIQLAVLAMVVVLVLAIPLGMVAALKPDTWYGRAVQGFLAAGLAIPTFWLGLLLIIAFSVQLGWLPAASTYNPIWEDPVAVLEHTLLPALAIGLHASTVTARFVATSLTDVMEHDFVRTARAKGANEGTVIARHALRNALLPTVTVVGLQLGTLLGGAIVVEVVFTYPGVGRLLFGAISSRDYALIQGALLLVVVIFVVLNLLIDVLYAYLDPRIRLT